MENFTPKEIVSYLDKYIIGQYQAKKAVALALRNRYRRKQLPLEMQDDIIPKNIILIGPTGVGKTEIARRLAKLVKAPFIKVEATKFTEVGYVGRDVESMIRDLVEISIRIVKNEMIEQVKSNAEYLANQRILEILVPMQKKENNSNPFQMFFGNTIDDNNEQREDNQQEDSMKKELRTEMWEKLTSGLLEDKMIQIEIEEQTTPTLEVFPGTGMEEVGINLQNILGNIVPKKKRKKKLAIKEARKILTNEEAQKLIDIDEVTKKAIERAEESGIVFLDEIDKIAGKDSSSGPDVSRGGVQRDILPIVEGSTVMSKYGPVKTDHMLFIAAGAFHVAKPSDLIPELQGRFPIRVELESLSQSDFQQILTEPKNSLIKQYRELIGTEGVQITFSKEGIEEIAYMAYQVNKDMENIGARRLHTIMEKLLEDVSYEAPNMQGNEIVIDVPFVKSKLQDIISKEDLSKYIL